MNTAIRSRMSLIMEQIGPETSELYVLELEKNAIFDFVYTPASANIYYVPKKCVHFVFGDFPLPIMLNVHVFGTKIKIRTCKL